MKAAGSLALFVSLVGTPPGPIARSIAREAARLATAPEIQPARSVVDDYRLDNPYPGAQGGASVPGVDALTMGRAQFFAVGSNEVFNSSLVNEFPFSYMRHANDIGTPKGDSASISSQGFVTAPDAGHRCAGTPV